MLRTLDFACQLPFTSQSARRKMYVCAAVADRRKSLYEVLQVNHNASQREIKTAYRTLAKLYHPDATSRFMDSSINSPTDGRYFIEIQNAYATLSDPDTRAVYDLNLVGGSRRRWTANMYQYHPTQGRRWETDQCW